MRRPGCNHHGRIEVWNVFGKLLDELVQEDVLGCRDRDRTTESIEENRNCIWMT